jgi:hypothetical protein
MQAVIFNTAGDGYWSTRAKSVEIVNMQLGYVAEDKDFGELCVYFNTRDWDVSKDGLIYTDSAFLEDLKAFLLEQGLSDVVDYSEQGMQGEDYVSLDVEGDFLQAWERKFNVTLEAM